MEYTGEPKKAVGVGLAAQPSLSDMNAVSEELITTGTQYGSVEPHVFSDPARAEHWRNVYENAKYECRHRFDPSFQWSAKGEVLLKRKVIIKTPPTLPNQLTTSWKRLDAA